MADKKATIAATEDGKMIVPSAGYTQMDFGNLDALPTGVIGENLQKASDMKEVEAEIRDLEIDHPGIVASLCPSEIAGEKMPDPAIQLQARRKLYAEAIKTFLVNQPLGAHMISDIFSTRIETLAATDDEEALKASLIGQPIRWQSVYAPAYPLCLQRGRVHQWKKVYDGTDTIQYENPINAGVAVVHNPNGQPDTVRIIGGKTPVYPMWLRTEAYYLDLFEWSARLIKPVVEKKAQFREELDKAIDDQMITQFDAAVPDGSSVYDPVSTSVLHPTHIVTDATGTLSFDKFRTAARKLVHTDSTGTAHNAPRGVAMVDELSLFDLEDAGSDEWTEQSVEKFNRNGFGQLYDGSVTVPDMTLQHYSIIRNPRATSTRNVRFWARPEFVGYLVPISFLGKRTWVRTIPMTGGDPNYGQIRNENMPPGFAMMIGAWECIAITIPGILHVSKVAQT